MIIYKIQNKINGKVYIGQTVRNIEVRMAEHARKSKTAVDKAIQKYGIEAFSVEVIDTAENIDELNQKEIYWIKEYGSLIPTGYNMCAGGENTSGYHHTNESKLKMSAAKAGLFNGERNPFYGKRHTEKTRVKMSEQRKGMKHLTEQQVEKLRTAHHTVEVVNVETGEVFESVKAAAEKYELKDTHITRVCKGKRKTTGGYHWKYKEESLECGSFFIP